MKDNLDQHWLLKSQADVVALGWEKFIDHLQGGNAWMLLPQDLEIIVPHLRYYFQAFMFGDGEIDVFFTHASQSGSWQRDEVFYFSRYRFERYSSDGCTVSSNMNAFIADRNLPRISDKLSVEIDARLIGDWNPIDPQDNRKRFW